MVLCQIVVIAIKQAEWTKIGKSKFIVFLRI